MQPTPPALPTADPLGFFEENGYLGPLRAFAPEGSEVRDALSSVRGWDRREKGWARNRHLDTPPIARLCRSERIITTLRRLLGEDLLLWRSNVFAISSRDVGFGWHQDDYRTLLVCPPGSAHCSVQLNLTASTETNCVTVIPGTHRYDPDELRRRGYVKVPWTERGAYGTPYWGPPPGATRVDMPMHPGEFYVFHSRLLHASVRARAMTSKTVRNPLAGGWALLRAVAAARFTREHSTRYSIALRVATPGVRLLPAAFAEAPARAVPVLLCGRDSTRTHGLGEWAA